MTTEKLLSEIKEFGAHNSAVIDGKDIVYDPELLNACKQNFCGNYGRNWMCPPSVGDAKTLIGEAKKYPFGILFQTVSSLEDSYDFEGMTAAKQKHNQINEKVRLLMEKEYSGDFMLLGIGGCDICPRCEKIDNNPCRFPHRALASMEAYCIFVAPTAEACGMKYINGENTVTYFSLILLHSLK